MGSLVTETVPRKSALVWSTELYLASVLRLCMLGTDTVQPSLMKENCSHGAKEITAD